MMHQLTTIQRALISVSDKTDLIPFATALNKRGIEIISTGGTATQLKEANIPVIDISDFTGFPEMMEGRLKTLHPKVHGGILGRRDVDADVMHAHDIHDIDLIVVNLYPFSQTVQNPQCTMQNAIENIDIGGPTMLRAAAKNHEWVTAIVDPMDYTRVIETIDAHQGAMTHELRYELAVKVFSHTAAYDSAIANYLSQRNESGEAQTFSKSFNLNYTLSNTLRYGENPQQAAALYLDRPPAPHTIATAELKQGKPLSFNNLADGDAALECVKQFDTPACVIVKHANPCGIAMGANLLEAYQKAYACDPESSFGGIIAFNHEVDETVIKAIFEQQFVEVIIAPAFTTEALHLAQQKANLRLLATGAWTQEERAQGWDIKRIRGGILVQNFDDFPLTAEDYRIVSETAPSETMMRDLKFALKAVKFVKSNAIVLAKDGHTIGIGAGQMSRVFSLKIAEERVKAAGLSTQGAVLASDAFFPFRDSIDIAAKMGIQAIIQPSGSKRDEEVIQAANEHGIALVFIPQRHFRH